MFALPTKNMSVVLSRTHPRSLPLKFLPSVFFERVTSLSLSIALVLGCALSSSLFTVSLSSFFARHVRHAFSVTLFYPKWRTCSSNSRWGLSLTVRHCFSSCTLPCLFSLQLHRAVKHGSSHELLSTFSHGLCFCNLQVSIVVSLRVYHVRVNVAFSLSL